MVFLRIWTDEKIINTLKDISIEYRVITNKLLIKLNKEEKICNPSLIRQRFNSLENACKRANVKFENNKGKSYWTKEKIYEVGKNLSNVYKKLNKEMLNDLHINGVICHPTHIRNRVGSIKDFFASVGIEYDIKSYKDMFGEKYATAKIEKTRKTNTRWNKEKIDIVLKDVFNNKKIKTISNYEKYAKGKKEIPSTDVIGRYYGTIANALKENNIQYDSYYWPKERIIKQLKFLDKHYGPLVRCEINHIYSKRNLICKVKCIRDVCSSLKKAAELANIKFIEPQEKGYTNGKIGKEETRLLNEIEDKKDINLIRQFKVKTNDTVYFIDGYDKINNIAYEIDDKSHMYKEKQYLDNIRENEIKDILNCEFERIKTY